RTLDDQFFADYVCLSDRGHFFSHSIGLGQNNESGAMVRWRPWFWNRFRFSVACRGFFYDIHVPWRQRDGLSGWFPRLLRSCVHDISLCFFLLSPAPDLAVCQRTPARFYFRLFPQQI